MASTSPLPPAGGSFLLQSMDEAPLFTPEQFGEEQKMIYATCMEFLRREVHPHLEQIDRPDHELMVQLLNKAGDLGLLGASLPPEYQGMGEGMVSSLLITEALGAGHSFSVSMAAHTGIGTLPILYFGSEEQKAKYLPRLATGEWKGAYALTEPEAGSDALSIRTRADLSEDGKAYLLQGQKIWITNAGFADLFVVFAKIQGKAFSAFIVERDSPGLSLGEEEKKMGIKGSSTRSLFLENTRVPVENLLGEAGKGHHIAFQILNLGRAKLCAAALGAAKEVKKQSLDYARHRHQFGQPLSAYGVIRQKLVQMELKIMACESALYRLAGWMDLAQSKTAGEGTQMLHQAEEYAIECAILKVAGSEVLDFVVDEGVQIHGGNGFSDEYNVSRAYRDSRINRIFEGTNEINRLLIMDMLIKRGLQGRIQLMKILETLESELLTLPSPMEPPSVLGEEKDLLARLKKAALLCLGLALDEKGKALETEQEILLALGDMVIDLFLSESLLLRREKQALEENLPAGMADPFATLYLHQVAAKWEVGARPLINALVKGEKNRVLLLGLRRWTKTSPVDTIDLQRKVWARWAAEQK